MCATRLNKGSGSTFWVTWILSCVVMKHRQAVCAAENMHRAMRSASGSHTGSLQHQDKERTKTSNCDWHLLHRVRELQPGLSKNSQFTQNYIHACAVRYGTQPSHAALPYHNRARMTRVLCRATRLRKCKCGAESVNSSGLAKTMQRMHNTNHLNTYTFPTHSSLVYEACSARLGMHSKGPSP